MPLNERVRHSPKFIFGRVGAGVAQLGVSRRGRRFVALLGRCVVRRNIERRLFLCFGHESPPRAHPDRRPDLCDGLCCSAGLRSPKFNFGDFVSRAWRVVSGIKGKIEFFFT